MTLRVAHFTRYYGSDLYFGWNKTAEPWAHTSDGIIPWRLFYLLYARMGRLMALDRLVTAQAVMAAITVTMAADKQKGRETLRNLVSDALGKD